MTQPTVGRIVQYTLTDQDANAIEQQRADLKTRANRATAGQVYPAVIVRVFNPSVNLQVLLDGTDTYWATSRVEGEGPGTWAWPTRKDT